VFLCLDCGVTMILLIFQEVEGDGDGLRIIGGGEDNSPSPRGAHKLRFSPFMLHLSDNFQNDNSKTYTPGWKQCGYASPCVLRR